MEIKDFDLSTLSDRFTNYNKIINLTFIRDNGEQFTIKCPAKGQKPNIEISGSISSTVLASQLSVTIRNLYYDRLTQGGSSFTKLRVEAGYEGCRKIAFEGDIFYMCTPEPGPESETTILVMTANITTWLNKTVDLHFDANFSLYAAVSRIAETLGMSVLMAANDMTCPEPFTYQGVARNALDKLLLAFKGVRIYHRDGALLVTTEVKPLPLREIEIPFLSAPVTILGGGDDGITATFTSPWNPELRPGDFVRVNTGYYNVANSRLNYTKPKTRGSVSNIEFQFGTVTKSNKMVVTVNIDQGFGG